MVHESMVSVIKRHGVARCAGREERMRQVNALSPLMIAASEKGRPVYLPSYHPLRPRTTELLPFATSHFPCHSPTLWLTHSYTHCSAGGR